MNNTSTTTDVRSGSLALLFALATSAGLAQATCTDLVIDHIWYSAFDTNALEVRLTNNGGVDFSAPEFNLVNTAFDTVAREPFDFFAMPSGVQTHQMQLLPGMSLPTAPFTGELLLFYADGLGQGSCSFPLNSVELCPPPPCTELFLSVWPMDTVVNTILYWSVFDVGNNFMTDGFLAMDTATGSITDTLCLPAGGFTFNIEQSPFGSGGPFICNLYREQSWSNSQQLNFSGVGVGVLPFSFYSACVDGVNAVAEPVGDDLRWTVSNGTLSISNAHGNDLGAITVFDIRGTRIAQRTVNASTAMFDLSSHAQGVYIFNAAGTGAHTIQRFILH
ncbi:MAG: T9SS type A sorting domain-containing protein [Flavobacteriales bacterium]|nr:T9SS type A sorting domain-containing protein [Flavobacteriales bacterium]